MHALVRRARGRLRRSAVARAVQARFGTPLAPDKWVFVLGCYNSGTTLLGSILASHPAASGLPAEGVAFTDALPWPESYGWTRLWYMCEPEMGIPEDASAARRADRIKRQWGAEARTGPVEMFVEKSVANVCRVGFLQKHFAPAYFVHIVRNGFAAAEGIRRKAAPAAWGNSLHADGYPIEMCARQWLRSEEVVEEVRPTTERLVSITYEDLCANPESVLRRVTEFVGVDAFPEGIERAKWQVQGAVDAIRNRNDRSFSALTPGDRKKIVEVAGTMLEKRGYL